VQPPTILLPLTACLVFGFPSAPRFSLITHRLADLYTDTTEVIDYATFLFELLHAIASRGEDGTLFFWKPDDDIFYDMRLANWNSTDAAVRRAEAGGSASSCGALPKARSGPLMTPAASDSSIGTDAGDAGVVSSAGGEAAHEKRLMGGSTSRVLGGGMLPGGGMVSRASRISALERASACAAEEEEEEEAEEESASNKANGRSSFIGHSFSKTIGRLSSRAPSKSSGAAKGGRTLPTKPKSSRYPPRVRPPGGRFPAVTFSPVRVKAHVPAPTSNDYSAIHAEAEARKAALAAMREQFLARSAPAPAAPSNLSS
jgi:hypothetical protein